MATRWRSPPDSAAGRAPALSARPTRSRASRARRSASGTPSPKKSGERARSRARSARQQVERLEHEPELVWRSPPARHP